MLRSCTNESIKRDWWGFKRSFSICNCPGAKTTLLLPLPFSWHQNYINSVTLNFLSGPSFYCMLCVKLHEINATIRLENKQRERNIWVQISWKAQNEILNNPDSSWTLSFFWWGMCHHLQRDPGREQQRNRVSRDVGQLADARPAVPLQKLRVPQMLPVLDSKAIRRGPGGTPLPFPQLPTTPGCGNSSALPPAPPGLARTVLLCPPSSFKGIQNLWSSPFL